MKSLLSYLTPALGLLSTTSAIDVNFDDPSSVNSAMSSIAYDMLTYYKGNLTGGTPGILPGPCDSTNCYYWWQAGAMWGLLINYWTYSGDSTYNPTIVQALQWQVGPSQNYNPPNQSKNMGVDDQDFWGFAAMEAAEAGLPDVGNGAPSWLALAQAVFNFQKDLWDDASCGGGFRWQVFRYNPGYNLKNTISNGGFFNLAARLARYTGNATYAEWAEKTYNWMSSSLLFEKNNDDGNTYIWDNTDADLGCVGVEHHIWSYNYGINLFGAAMMYNYTNGSGVWEDRINIILDSGLNLLYPDDYGKNILSEVLCRDSDVCNNDQNSFKAYVSRWMAVTSEIAPFTADRIKPKLLTSAKGAAAQCSGGDNGRTCGRQWWNPVWDGSKGVGQQMSALAALGATQMSAKHVPLTASTGGTSVSDPNAGANAPHDPLDYLKKITNGDRAGAAILTMLVIGFIIGMSVWIVL